jgi:hypothetical protein
MESFSSLLKKEHTSELVLSILLVVYLILGLKTPEPIASIIDTLLGKLAVVLVVIYLFMRANPILAILSLFAAYVLMRGSSVTTGSDALKRFAPSEEKKSSQFSAFNQFPYTLEQEVVAKMAPLVQSGSSISQASYKPLLDNLHDASPVNA